MVGFDSLDLKYRTDGYQYKVEFTLNRTNVIQISIKQLSNGHQIQTISRDCIRFKGVEEASFFAFLSLPSNKERLSYLKIKQINTQLKISFNEEKFEVCRYTDSINKIVYEVGKDDPTIEYGVRDAKTQEGKDLLLKVLKYAQRKPCNKIAVANALLFLKLAGWPLDNLNLSYLYIEGVNFSDLKEIRNIDFSFSTIVRCCFDRLTLHNCNFKKCELIDLSMRDIKARFLSFSAALSLKRVNFNGASILKLFFADIDLLEDLNLININIGGGVFFHRSKLKRGVIEQLDSADIFYELSQVTFLN